MKKTILFYFYFITIIIVKAQSPQLQWAKNMGGTGFICTGSSIAVDASGNVYTTGQFTGTVDFDPGVGIYNLTSAGSNDVFIVKLDASGNFVWAKSMGGTGNDSGKFISIDVSGNIYTTGSYSLTADFDPGVGITNLTSAGSEDAFISKLDANGNLVWAKSIGGTGIDYGYSMDIDGSGMLHIIGNYEATVDFDPNTGITNLTSNGGYDIFIIKLDANGNLVWAKSMGDIGYEYGSFITIDVSGNVYATGDFTDTVDFNPNTGITNLISAGLADIFIVKLDASGNFIWAKNMGGTGDDFTYSMALDASGSVYTTGSYNVTADFDPGVGITNLTSAGVTDIFISKLDTLGNFIWAKSVGGIGNDFGYSIAIDASGRALTTGYFNGTADFDPNIGTTNLTSVGANDIFISELDASGNFVGAKSIGGVGGDYASSICVDVLGTAYLTGKFSGTVDFDPNLGTTNLTALGNSDIFVLKLLQCASLSLTPSASTVCSAATVTLTANGSDMYNWITTDTTSVIFVNPIVNTTYSLTGNTSLGCVTSASIAISVIPSKILSGSVTNTLGPVNGNMILYKYSPVLSKWDSIAFTPFSSVYSFGAIDSALYVIKAIPTATNVQVTYGASSISWQGATIISQGCATNTTHNITIIPLINIGVGAGSFSGKITEGNGFEKRMGSGFKPTIPGNPIGGIIVKGGKNPGGQMFVQTLTDTLGNYTLPNLPPNTGNESYFILVDIPGLDTNQTYHEIITSTNNVFINLDFVVDSAKINPIHISDVSVNDISAIEHHIKVFPNPATNKVTIQYNLLANSNVKIELYDILGKSIKTILPATDQSIKDYTYSFQLNEITAGMYIMKLKINNSESVVKLVISN